MHLMQILFLFMAFSPWALATVCDPDDWKMENLTVFGNLTIDEKEWTDKKIDDILHLKRVEALTCKYLSMIARRRPDIFLEFVQVATDALKGILMNIDMVLSRMNHIPEVTEGALKFHANELPKPLPRIVYIPIGGLNDRRRYLREAAACPFPKTLQTAALHCRIYPTSITCIQRCAFGYTLDGGIAMKRKCKFAENKWQPSGFTECKPFVDCTISLISGGSMNCSANSVLQGPECNVECLHYEDKDAVPMATYTCGIDGKWDPPLPFCVVPTSGLGLVAPPDVKYHESK